MFIKPKAGLKVRDPISKTHLLEAGEDKPESSYWVRRLASGDVVMAPLPVLVVDLQIPDSNNSPAGEG